MPLYLVLIADGKHNFWGRPIAASFGVTAYAISNCLSVKLTAVPEQNRVLGEVRGHGVGIVVVVGLV